MPIDTSKINKKLILTRKNMLNFLQRKSPVGYTPTELGKLFKRNRSTVSEMINELKRENSLKMIKDGRNHYYYYEGDK
jgi:DNA-binding IclR family transcriptional regulator